MDINQPEHERRVEVLKTVVTPAWLVGREAHKAGVVNIDIAAIDVGKIVVRFDVPQLPQIGVCTKQREGQSLDHTVRPAKGRERMMCRVVRHVNGEQKRRSAKQVGQPQERPRAHAAGQD